MSNHSNSVSEKVDFLIKKVNSGNRILTDDAVFLYENASLGILTELAFSVKNRINGRYVYYNKNFHIEPTNVCVFNCDFCSFSTLEEEKGWKNSHDDILNIIEEKISSGARELHITGGANPSYNLDFYTELFKHIKKLYPFLHIKAFTAVEIDYISKLAGLDFKDTLKILKESGLDSIPGGGAEIFDEEVREIICSKKTSGKRWLEIHEAAHKLGINSNATMLYGHIETVRNRIEHMERLRNLQDKTKGFNAFIPLKFKNKNNRLSSIPEAPLIEDLKVFAISRIFLDNIPHLKAYWPMLGKDIARLLLHFGVDDLDGTIQNTTKIYSMAGSSEDNPGMSEEDIKSMIISSGFVPAERDSLYNLVS
ncbi:MAG: aminofutalosine synthase MqnE [Bacteroidetes bacterium]|nr:aminofutalosine synthase MqnE [Bacteroidota bacterium]